MTHVKNHNLTDRFNGRPRFDFRNGEIETRAGRIGSLARFGWAAKVSGYIGPGLKAWMKYGRQKVEPEPGPIQAV
jgi:hypothetical protein